CNWTIRKRLPRCKMRLKKRLLAFSRRLHARIRKTRYMHKMRCLLINRRSLLLALRLLWKTPIFPSNSRFPRLRSEERFSRNAETDLVCRLLLEKKKKREILLVLLSIDRTETANKLTLLLVYVGELGVECKLVPDDT